MQVKKCLTGSLWINDLDGHNDEIAFCYLRSLVVKTSREMVFIARERCGYFFMKEEIVGYFKSTEKNDKGTVVGR